MVTDWKETVNWAIAPYNTINSLTRQFHFFVTINPKGGESILASSANKRVIYFKKGFLFIQDPKDDWGDRKKL
jgi:hypothetical protein